ncbi:MAG TPA: DUF3999 family protein [Vulgatibacter sp.]|nr:DUF3999 family protein [Vulgatibacter sp.]
MIRRLPITLLLALATPALAGELEDYAFGWPLQLEGEGGVWRFELTPEVYAVIQDEGLGDVEIFDAKGAPVAMGPYRLPPEPPPPERVQLPVFPIRRSAAGEALDLRVQVARGDDRSIRSVAAQVGADSAAVEDFLLDASRVETAVEKLFIQPPDGIHALQARIAVDASDDLDRWRIVQPSATVLFRHAGQDGPGHLHVDLPPTRAPYLRLRSLAGSLPAGFAVEAQIARPADRPMRRWVEARSEGRDGRWISRGSFVLVGAEHDAEEAGQGEAEVSAGPRARRWRIEATPPLREVPALRLALDADAFAFLPQGAPPFLLAAGSAPTRRSAPLAGHLALRLLREGADAAR